jgi:uncharacterized protein (TIGR02646 family)
VIRIKKPTQAPAILMNRGVSMARQFCERYDADSDAYKSGSKSFDFRASLYRSASVKNALRTAQYDKCALCESKVTHIAWGDVEHFRPKSAYRQSPDDPLVRPGYYWLAYEWSNLLFCCQLCNQRFKRNHFPLTNPSRRAKSHNDDIANEEPLLINPAVEDPSKFLEFRENLIQAIGGNARGERTIDVFGLNRKELEDFRLTWFLWFRQLIPFVVELIKTREKIASKVIQCPSLELTEHLIEINARIEQFVGDSAQYTAMVRAALGSAS